VRLRDILLLLDDDRSVVVVNFDEQYHPCHTMAFSQPILYITSQLWECLRNSYLNHKWRPNIISSMVIGLNATSTSFRLPPPLPYLVPPIGSSSKLIGPVQSSWTTSPVKKIISHAHTMALELALRWRAPTPHRKVLVNIRVEMAIFPNDQVVRVLCPEIVGIGSTLTA
jgi:hypothetical protein